MIASQVAPISSGNGTTKAPQFSAIWYGLDRRASAQETIASLAAQTYGDFELVVEDCGSTDGTLELFQAAAIEDNRIRIFERWTRRPGGETLLSALKHCRGEYIVVCPSEGRLLPHAFDVLAKEFAERPSVGAICTTGFLFNAFGETHNYADVVSLLFAPYCPFLPAVFFRREALLAAGID